MSVNKRLERLEREREAELDRLVGLLVDWIEQQPPDTQVGIWRLVPTDGCDEHGIPDETIWESRGGRLEPDATDRARAREAWRERFPEDLLEQFLAVQADFISEMEGWFCCGA